MEFIEVSAKTVDDAITKACIELGVSSDKLDIQVISEGSSGFLGFGSKPAVIRAGKKPEEEVVVEKKEVRPEKEVKEEPHVKPQQEKKEVKRKFQSRRKSLRKKANRKSALRKRLRR